MDETTRAHLIISGRVQGVCYRAETQRAAMRFGVHGWVKNKSDGTVEAEVEGTQADVISLIEWCKKGPAIAKVDRVQVTWKACQGDSEPFEIRF